MPLDARTKRPSTTGLAVLCAGKNASTALATVPSSPGGMSKFARTALLTEAPWLSAKADDPRMLQIRSWRLLRAETADARGDATIDFGEPSMMSIRREEKRHGSAGGFHTASGGMFDPFNRGAEVFGRHPRHFECASRRFARGARGELHFRTLCHSSTRLKVMREACGSHWAVESLERLHSSAGPRSLSPLSRSSSPPPPKEREKDQTQRSTSPKAREKAQELQVSTHVQSMPLFPSVTGKVSPLAAAESPLVPAARQRVSAVAHAKRKTGIQENPHAVVTVPGDHRSSNRHWRQLKLRQEAAGTFLDRSSSASPSWTASRTLTTTLTANSHVASRHMESLNQKPLWLVYSKLMTKYGGLYGALYSENSVFYKEENALTIRQWCGVLQNNLHLCSAAQARQAFESFGELDASGMVTVLEFTSFLESVSPLTTLMSIRRRMVRSLGSILAGIRALADEVHSMGLGILPTIEKKTHFDPGSLQAAWYRKLRKHEFLAIVEKVVGFTMDEATAAWKMLHISGKKHLTLFELACALQSISPLLVVEDSRLQLPATDNSPKRGTMQGRRGSGTGNIVRRGSTQKKADADASSPQSNARTACPSPSALSSCYDAAFQKRTTTSLNTSSGSATNKWRSCTQSFTSIATRGLGEVMRRSGTEPRSLASVWQPTVIGADHRSSTTRSTTVTGHTGQTKQTLRSCMPHPFLEGFRLFLSRRGAGCEALRRVLQKAMDAHTKDSPTRTDDIATLMLHVGIPRILTNRFLSLLGFEVEGGEKKGDRLGLVEFERLLGVYAPQGALYEVADELINNSGSLEAALITNPIFEEMGDPWDKPESLLNQAQLAKAFGKLLSTPPAHFPFLWAACDANGDGWVTLRGVYALLDALLLVEIQQRDQKIRGLCAHAARHMKRSFRQFHRSVNAAVQQAREPLFSTKLSTKFVTPERASVTVDTKKKILKKSETSSSLPELSKKHLDVAGSNTTSSGDRSKNRENICYDCHEQEDSFRQTQYVNTVKWV
eukprot:GEMP01008990.1.p1 GENE.GEMP01008990.1~~GEMP01008990.1.p1  ORF type:complete len:1009 (+),score=279.99 GEMP01008990.1:46-3072(+)